MINQKLKKILLIDDSFADNYLHTIVLEDVGVTDQIVTCYTAMEALEYLSKKDGDDYPKPELIFLDINMPAMNGWEFLDEYDKLDDDTKSGIIICMLTTSFSDRDLEKANEHPLVTGFINKPLDEDNVKELYVTHFKVDS